MATLDIVKDILHENLSIEPETVTLDSTFDSLDIDSLDMVELIVALEERCDIDFGEPEGIGTVAELIAYVDGLQ